VTERRTSSAQDLDELAQIVDRLPREALPAAYGLVFAALGRSGLIRSANNPIAVLGESVAALYFGGELAAAGTKGHDVLTDEGRRIQVKALRQTGRYNRSTLSRIYNDAFDEVMAVVFNADLTIREAWFIPKDVALDQRNWREQYKAWSVSLTRKLSQDPRVRVASLEQLRREAKHELPSGPPSPDV
jgi:hypothetical protein